MEIASENVLNATLLEPRVKHATIFAEFDKLNEGEEFILLNDHDPKPLYLQLLSQRGDIFSWDYIEAGPEWWRIRIAKNVIHSNTQSDDENVLNVTLLEPRRKHPTIFERFDQLNGGESLTILNDHNPKPLYYQLLGERGNIFKWEYLESGPEWWRIKITKNKSGEADASLGEIAAKDLRKAQIFKKYGLDFSCSGKKSVREACEEKGIDADKVEQELSKSETNQEYTTKALPYNEWNIDFLSDFIINTSHLFLKKNLPDIKEYAKKVLQVHGLNHPELTKVHKLTEAVYEEINNKIQENEQKYFPYIKHIVAVQNGSQTYEKPSFTSIHDQYNNIEEANKSISDKLKSIRECTKDFTLPSDACASYTLLYKLLGELDDEIQTQNHLENNILFPKAVDVERKVS